MEKSQNEIIGNSQSLNHDAQASNVVELKKNVTFSGAIAFVVGSMIGSGIFISPKGVLIGAGSAGLSLIIWFFGGFVSIMGALSYTELGTMITKSGGEYAYLAEAFHPVFAYLFAFMYLLILLPCGLAVICMTCSQYLSQPFLNDDCGEPPEAMVKCMAATILCIVAAVNVASAKVATQVQIVFTVAKLIPLVIIIIGGIYNLSQGYTEHLSNGFEWIDGPASAGSIALGFYSSMWAYGGWNNLNLIVEELQEPQKNLPRSIFLGIPLVMIVYVLTNISYFTVLSPNQLLQSPAVAVSWAEQMIPNYAWCIPIFVAISTFGACNGSVFAASRLVFAAAREGHMVNILSFVNVHRFTPASAVIFMVSIAILMLIPTDIATLIDFLSFATWMFYGLVFCALLWLRYKAPNAVRPFKVPIICPIIALIISIFLVLAPIIDEPQLAYLYAFLLILAGLFFYVPFVHYKMTLPGMGDFNTFWQLFLEIAPPPKFSQMGLLEEEATNAYEKEKSKCNNRDAINEEGLFNNKVQTTEL